jgi:hypothetical protein
MLTFLRTRRLFAVGITLAASLFCLSLFLSLSGIILPDGGKSVLWIIAPMMTTCIVSSILFVFWNKRIFTAIITAMTGFGLTFLLRKILIAKFPMMNIPSNEATAIITTGFISASIIFCYTVGRSFRFVASILIDKADSFNKTEMLLNLRSWAWDSPKNMSTERTLSYLFTYGSVTILLAAASSLRYKDSGTGLSIICTALFFSELSVFLITKQITSIARFLLAERHISDEIIKHWNSTIIFLLIASCAVSLVIPHSFSFYDESTIRDFINRILSFFSVNLYLPGHSIPENIITPQEPGKTNPFNIPYKVRIILAAGIILHALCALAGLFFLKIAKNKRSKSYAQFCIRRYLEWINLAKNILEVLRFLLLAVTFPFRIFFTPKISDEENEYNNTIAISFVSNFNELPNEKKAEIRTIIDAFMKLAHTAERKGFPYHYSMGPSEFIESIIPLAPAMSGCFIESASTINESRYSPRILSKEKIDGFVKQIDVIIKSIDGETNGIK